MALLAYNKTTSPLTLPIGSRTRPDANGVLALRQPPVLPASSEAGSRGAATDVTLELRPDGSIDPVNGIVNGLTSSDFLSLQSLVSYGKLDLEWTSSTEYVTTEITPVAPSLTTHVHATHVHAEAIADGASGFLSGADKTKMDNQTTPLSGWMTEDTIGGGHSTITLTTLGTWYPVTNLGGVALIGGMTFTTDAVNGDYLEVPEADYYECTLMCDSARNSTATIRIGIFVDSNVNPDGGTIYSIGGSGEIASSSDQLSMYIAAGSKVRLKVASTDTAGDVLTLHKTKLRLERVRGILAESW